jgi:thiol-disulfide isomerase/thioredoxin
LILVSEIWFSLHRYDPSAFHDRVQPYTLDSETIQWFVNEYKRRIDEYIAAAGMIDEIVRRSEYCIRGLTGDVNANPRYGHPNFNWFNLGRDLKEYYEQRLGIRDLKVDTRVFREYAESAGVEAPGEFTVTIYTERELFPFEELTTPDGQPYNRAASAGKYVLVNLFATWHPYCRKENPSVQRLHERFPVLGIALGESGETVERYMREEGYSFPVTVDSTNRLRKKYAERLPASYVVGPDGRIVARINGNKEWDGEEMMKVLRHVVEEGEAGSRRRIDAEWYK